MRVREFAKTVDHTLLKPDATEEQIVSLCGEAATVPLRGRVHSAVLRAARLEGAPRTDVKVATVVSFPFGNDATAVKTAAVREAITRGASEIDVVMNVSKFLSGEFDYVADELASLTQEVSVVAMNNGLNDVVMKVIIETAYLTDKMKRLATQIVASSGADFVKTSTGFGPGGATTEDVALLREEAPEGLRSRLPAASRPWRTPWRFSTPAPRGSA
jgi:deoxyribose-phosphate aldolase